MYREVVKPISFHSVVLSSVLEPWGLRGVDVSFGIANLVSKFEVFGGGCTCTLRQMASWRLLSHDIQGIAFNSLCKIGKATMAHMNGHRVSC